MIQEILKENPNFTEITLNPIQLDSCGYKKVCGTATHKTAGTMTFKVYETPKERAILWTSDLTWQNKTTDKLNMSSDLRWKILSI